MLSAFFRGYNFVHTLFSYLQFLFTIRTLLYLNGALDSHLMARASTRAPRPLTGFNWLDNKQVFKSVSDVRHRYSYSLII